MSFKLPAETKHERLKYALSNNSTTYLVSQFCQYLVLLLQISFEFLDLFV